MQESSQKRQSWSYSAGYDFYHDSPTSAPGSEDEGNAPKGFHRSDDEPGYEDEAAGPTSAPGSDDEPAGPTSFPASEPGSADADGEPTRAPGSDDEAVVSTSTPESDGELDSPTSFPDDEQTAPTNAPGSDNEQTAPISAPGSDDERDHSPTSFPESDSEGTASPTRNPGSDDDPAGPTSFPNSEVGSSGEPVELTSAPGSDDEQAGTASVSNTITITTTDTDTVVAQTGDGAPESEISEEPQISVCIALDTTTPIDADHFAVQQSFATSLIDSIDMSRLAEFSAITFGATLQRVPRSPVFDSASGAIADIENHFPEGGNFRSLSSAVLVSRCDFNRRAFTSPQGQKFVVTVAAGGPFRSRALPRVVRRARNRGGIQFIGVGVGDDAEATADILSDDGLNFQVQNDFSELADGLGPVVAAAVVEAPVA